MGTAALVSGCRCAGAGRGQGHVALARKSAGFGSIRPLAQLGFAQNLPAGQRPATIPAVSPWQTASSLADGQASETVRMIADGEHYQQVILQGIARAEVSVWIASANLKEVMIEPPLGTVARARGQYISITERLAELARAGVEIRILHASGPSRALARALARRRSLVPPRFERRCCPRVHLKLVAVDGCFLYLGSANFTGAGLGAKGQGRRNFEMGIVTDDHRMLDAAQERFQRIWTGKHCPGCRLRSECPRPLEQLG
jgi:phosphatidylserine/phosphatidylglycerophosphate/cardiolipin synthase-like enzyme